MAEHGFPSDLIALERGAGTALHLQLAERLRDLILTGQLPAGQKLPSIRAFAQTHGISRNTVVSVLDQLSAEGYLESRPGAGIWVGSQVPRALSETLPRQARPAKRLSRRGEIMTNQPRIRSIPGHPTFQPGTPASDSFPFKTWARLLKQNASPAGDERLNYHSINGLRALRENIADYVSASRGVRASPDRIVVTTGGQAALDLVARLLVDPGDTVLVEEPGYQGAQSVFAAAGADLQPLPVSEAGWDLDVVKERRPRAIYVTPSSQFPLGIAMSLQERLTLIDHARRHGSWILEDDYDSEYSFHARRIPALQGLVDDAPVIYFGTFSKLIFPSLRLGYMILPANLSDRVKNAISFTGHYAPLFLQAALSDFIAGGHFSRHLSRMRRIYQKRREVFLALCADHMETDFRALDFRSGIQITCMANDHFDDVGFVESLRDRNLNPAPLSSYYCHTQKRRGLLIGYAAVDEVAMAQGMAEMAEVLKQRAFAGNGLLQVKT
ncbi:MAG: PLP-dependent aminotransferase family protein [Pseudomonadota bacterium]